MADEDLCLLNNGSFTYIHPANGTKSCIDLTLCHPEILFDFSWKVLIDSHGNTTGP